MKDIEFITRIQVNGEKRELTKEEASELILRRVKEALEGMNYEKTACLRSGICFRTIC